MTLRVLHLVGSAVDDFYAELSRLYAADCLRSTADPSRYEFVIAHVDPDRRWRFPADLGDAALAAAPSMAVSDAIARIVALDVDVMVPQMFCVPGMTHYRALFDLLGIPYVGNPPDVMALGADKAHARAVVAAAGVDVPAAEVVVPGGRITLPPPTVVKPVDADNSFGVTLVRSADGYEAALASAFEHAGAALVESYVELGREVRCGIVVRDGELVALPLEEYALDATAGIRTAEDKVARGADGGLHLMAKDATRAWLVDVDDPVTAAVQDAAKRAHVALGCRHYSLTDFRIDPEGRPWFLEAGLYNSFARASVVATMARGAGIGLDELFASLVGQALRQA